MQHFTAMENNNESEFMCDTKMTLQLLLIEIICSQAVLFLPSYAAVFIEFLTVDDLLHNNMLTLTFGHDDYDRVLTETRNTCVQL